MYNNNFDNRSYNYRRMRRQGGNRKINWLRFLAVIVAGLMLGVGITWVMGLMKDDKADNNLADNNVKAETNVEVTTKDVSDIKEKQQPKKEETSGWDFGDQSYFIVIHKGTHKLELYHKGEEKPVKVYACAIALNSGDKHRDGDMTTPTSWGHVTGSIPGAMPGTDSQKVPFVVEDIYYAGDWTHDFGDGKGEIAGAYGRWFISLNTGWDGIGIHGTHDPSSIGTNASEGCIRLYNEDIDELKSIISRNNGGVGVNVVITED